MNEKLPTGPTLEEIELKIRQEEDERCEQFMKDHPELFAIPEVKRECGPEIAEFESLIASFESTFSLEALHQIVDLTPADAPKHPIREPARVALIPIVKLLNALKDETDITPEKHADLKKEYKRLSQAVGMINRDKVDHTR
jgi:hypothetical protein